MSNFNKPPTLSTKIKGIFYKSDVINNKTFYHFILPNIFHNDAKQSHTIDLLKSYDKKVEKYYHGNPDDQQSKLNNLIVDNNINTIKYFKPMYRENGLIHGNNSIDYTTFKGRSQDKLDLIVGLEYLLDIECVSGNFVNNKTHESITYWTIYINNHKEVTRID